MPKLRHREALHGDQKMKLLSLEEARAKYDGLVFHGNEIIEVIGEYGEPGSYQKWKVLAKCPCGKEYEAKLTTLKRSPSASCGCRRGDIKGKTMRRGIDRDVRKRSTRPCKKSPVCDAIGTVSRLRLIEVWESLPQEKVCKAWKDVPFQFVKWGLRSGFVKGKALVRLDPAKPFSPMNSKWEIQS